MSDFGVVCEWNPFHNGHARLLAEARRRGAERIVCVMSGNTVQRGAFAMADKYLRAEMAVRCGADLVLELPHPWSAASASFFAGAAISLLGDYCDTLIFGSESGDADSLAEAARMAAAPEFSHAYTQRLRAGEGAAAAFRDQLCACGYTTALGANDCLAIEYMRNAAWQGRSLSFEAVLRKGAAYEEEELTADCLYPSATALRRLWRGSAEDKEKTKVWMPHEVWQLLNECDQRGELTDERLLDRAVLSFFRLHTADVFAGMAEAGGGLAERICTAARQSACCDELFASLRTKRYTDAKLRRAMLFCMTGVTEALLTSMPRYTVLLAANSAGRELLAQKRRKARCPVITKPADVPRNEPQFAADEAVNAWFTLARRSPSDTAAMLRKHAYISES